VTTTQLIRKLENKIEYLWRENIRFQIVVEKPYSTEARRQRASRKLEDVRQQCVDLIGQLTDALPDVPPTIHLADDVSMAKRNDFARASTMLGRAGAAVVNTKAAVEQK
jgi:hypothetical protein